MNRVRYGIIGLMGMLIFLGCNLTFSAPTELPPGRATVLLIAPEANSQIAEGATIQLAARAEDTTGAGVSRIDFSVGDQFLGSQGTPNPEGQRVFTALQVWPAKGTQEYTVSAAAYRADNSLVGIARVTVRVVPLSGGVVPSNTPAVAPPSVADDSVPTSTLAPIGSNTPLPVTAPPIIATLTLPPTIPAALSTAPPSTPLLPNQPQARVITAFLNVREGPAPTYRSIGLIKAGEIVAILGRNEDRTWWAIQAPNGLRGWILNNPAYIETSGNLAGVPLAAAKPQPTEKPTATP